MANEREEASAPALATLAKKEIIDHAGCEECEETYLFMMKDEGHEFFIGLRTVLACLAFAEIEGAVPMLPAEWWHQVSAQ